MKLTARERQLLANFRLLQTLRPDMAGEAAAQFHRWVRAERATHARATAILSAPERPRRSRKNSLPS